MSRFTYDAACDAAYISLKPIGAGAAVRQRRLDATTTADFDAAGRLLGIEVLEAAERFSAPELFGAEAAAEWLTLREAAERSELSAATLRVLVHSGRLEAEKRGRDLYVTHAALLSYLDSRRGTEPTVTASAPPARLVRGPRGGARDETKMSRKNDRTSASVASKAAKNPRNPKVSAAAKSAAASARTQAPNKPKKK